MATRAERKQQTQQRKKDALKHFRDTATVTHACEAIGINRTTWYAWCKDDPEFKREVEACEKAVGDDLEKLAIQRARDGSDVLLIFLLKGNKPHKFKERVANEHTGAGGGAIQFTDTERANRVMGILDSARARRSGHAPGSPPVDPAPGPAKPGLQ